MSGIEGLLAGRVLGGRYRIEEVIGRGGMGAVYRGVDERLGRQVAVKVITGAGASDADSRERLRARFHREARAAAALPHHPNVVPVYDYGTDEALGLDYLVMELLRGSDLATRLVRAGPPPLAAGLRILREATRGIAVGHRAGVVHRDVKPGNIFLAESLHHEIQVRVLDFGIAKLATDEDTASQLTQDGRAPHSPAYASPEQLRGATHLTPASDVFSLGAVGFQLLTGERPFSDADRNRMSLGMPVAVPSLRERNPAIPEPVEEIVRRALAYDPTDRYPDAGAMGTALDDALRVLPDIPLAPYATAGVGGRPAAPDDDRTQFLEEDHTLLDPGSEFRPPVVPPPTAAPPRRGAAAPPPPAQTGRGGAGRLLAWLFVLALLVGGAVYAWTNFAPDDRLARGGGGESIPQAPPEIPVLTPEVSVEVPQEPTELDAAINNQEGLRYYRMAQYDSAAIQFRRAVEISPENAQYRRNLALTLLRLGAPADAERELRTAIRLDPTQDLAYANLAEVQLAMGDTVEAVASLERFLAVSTNPRQRGIAERQLRDLQAALAAPPLLMDTSTIAPDTAAPAPIPVPAPAPDTAGASPGL